MAISKIICKRCKTDLIKDYTLVNESLASALMIVHDNVAHTQDYQITLRGKDNE